MNEFRRLSKREDAFFFRQRLIANQLEPELAKMCICQVVWSPVDGLKESECP